MTVDYIICCCPYLAIIKMNFYVSDTRLTDSGETGIFAECVLTCCLVRNMMLTA